MNRRVVLIIFISLLSNVLYASIETDSEDAIHRKCNHRSKFTEKELEAALTYLKTRFINGASIKPQREPCKSLKVIPDFRCISEYERQVYVKAFRKVYQRSDFITNISYIHTFYWPFVNIMAQAFPWHNLVNWAVQKEIEKIDPSVIMPYWDTASDSTAPEKALVWDYFGHAGNQYNNYCVPDGPFNDLILKYPNNTCLKREWNRNGTINVWESPEVSTYIAQQGVGSLTNWGPTAFRQHFSKHVNIGGLHGDMGNVQATNEPLFHMYHWYDLQLTTLRWQLENDTTLVDLGLANMGRHVPPYDYEGIVVPANLETDTLLGFNTTTIAEGLTFGFGNNCYITDRIIEAILSILTNRKPQYPPAVQRLRNALPVNIFAEFFPKFADNTATELNYHLPDVGNTNTRCKPIPVPLEFNKTESGRQQLNRFVQAGVNLTELILTGERLIINFVKTLNSCGYCSPYVN